MVGSLWAAAALALLVPSARAIEIELLGDVAPDRVERQRAYARGAVPFPGTPDLSSLDQRLAAKGLARGNAIFVRVFKASSELEVWMQKGDTFTLLDTYPICHWTGTLGPKLKEGDKQSPEGFYSVASPQMRLFGRWPQAFNLGFPNAYDRANRRTGSHILVHGGCSSTGCFAMTELVQTEIRALAEAALAAGQARFHVHIFPFRMTEEAMAAHAFHLWSDFWRDLKVGYDSFERTRVPPRVGVCGTQYHITDGEPGQTGDAGQLAQMRPFQASRRGHRTPAAAEAACSPPIAAAPLPQDVPQHLRQHFIQHPPQYLPQHLPQPIAQHRAGRAAVQRVTAASQRAPAAQPAPRTRARHVARTRTGGQRTAERVAAGRAPGDKASEAFGEVYHEGGARVSKSGE